MITLEDLKKVISELPEKEYKQFRRWFAERDWQRWDQQIAADSRAGKLDFLVEEAKAAKKQGKLRAL
ncbi:MAG: hypothetical protein NTW14_08035 [bacterium]|nr:hypothetical protein [bacterium]